ncbi:related to conserved hypothetical Ustilaginaceae-specific protein [Ustilago trichophora]|uniref:Related to conserved hypothetical Ustilaginaceae-specific protein n=1 Tax=Ustilago trichophora TaxID=86804 RepID=A0A5C3DSM3_9BASI|nr:related to conserved hypothetical Ustilaginaceae-specific protein [Ustilago trichophora]
MQFKNSLFFTLVVVLLATVIPTSMARIEVSIRGGKDALPPKPRHPLFACVVKSTSCKKPSHFSTKGVAPRLVLTTCHEDGLFKNLYNRLSFAPGRGQFFNTFYVSCPQHDRLCYRASQKWTPAKMREILDADFKQNTNCHADVECYNLKDVDEQCFPKNES